MQNADCDMDNLELTGADRSHSESLQERIRLDWFFSPPAGGMDGGTVLDYLLMLQLLIGVLHMMSSPFRTTIVILFHHYNPKSAGCLVIIYKGFGQAVAYQDGGMNHLLPFVLPSACC